MQDFLNLVARCCIFDEHDIINALSNTIAVKKLRPNLALWDSRSKILYFHIWLMEVLPRDLIQLIGIFQTIFLCKIFPYARMEVGKANCQYFFSNYSRESINFLWYILWEHGKKVGKNLLPVQ